MTFENRINETPYFSALFFSSVAIVLFHQLFMGYFAIGGTDSVMNHYPNILFGHRAFYEFGTFSLWNHYIFSGTDITGSMQAHLLNPLYWPLLVFPEKYIFHALTVGFLIMNGLTGWLWSRIAIRLGAPGTGSLIVGVVAQAGMFFWFAMTTLIMVPMALFATISIYIVLTRESRSNSVNYLMLAPTLCLHFASPHPAYLIATFLPVIVVYLIITFPNCLYRPWRGFSLVFASATVTAVLFAAYRLVPVAIALGADGNVLSHMWDLVLPHVHANRSYFGLTVFNPSALGLTIGSAMDIAAKISTPGAHNQFHNALYFGIVPLIIVYAAVRADSSSKSLLLAAAYVTAQLTALKAFPLLTDTIYTLFFPYMHDVIFRTAANFSFLFLLVHCVTILNRLAPYTLNKILRECIVISGLAICAGVALHNRTAHETALIVTSAGGYEVLANFFRFVTLSIIVMVVIVCRQSIASFAGQKFGLLGVVFVLAMMTGAFGLYLMFGNLAYLGTESIKVMLANSLAVILVCTAVVLVRQGSTPKKVQFIALGCYVVSALVFLVPLVGDGRSPVPDHHFLVSIIGWGVFLALVITSISVLARFSTGAISAQSMMGFLLILTLGDLIAAYDNYSYVNVWERPFVQDLDDMYPTSATIQARVAGIEQNKNQQNLHTNPQFEKKSPEQEKLLMHPQCSNQNNLLANPKFGEEPYGQNNLLYSPSFRLVSDLPDGWDLAGTDLQRCPSAVDNNAQKDSLCLYYPTQDTGGNLYQDVTLNEDTYHASMGVWVRPEIGKSAAIFLTSKEANIGTPPRKIIGDGRWHWLSHTLVSRDKKKPLGSVRAHINVPSQGSAQIYHPRLVAGPILRPTIQPSDGHETAQQEKTLGGWNLGGTDLQRCPSAVDNNAQKDSLCLYYPTQDTGGNLYQDVTLNEDTYHASMGVWVRPEIGKSAAIFLTSKEANIGTPPRKIIGDGRWHWLSHTLVSRDKKKPLGSVRAHINVPSQGSAQIYHPRLVAGVVVQPNSQPNDGHEIVNPKDSNLAQIDFSSYRFNHVTQLNGYAANELTSNHAIVAKTPTYAGVDSDMPRDFVSFISTFREPDPSWFARFGLNSVLKDKRILDLLGVGYDIGANGGVLIRPDAIPRFAAFSNFEVADKFATETGEQFLQSIRENHPNLATATKKDAAYQRLTEKDFNPMTTILLESEPSILKSSAAPQEFIPLAYETPEADFLALQIQAESPRIVMFNDNFSPNWEAYWNEEKLPIMRANGLFMAVIIPSGSGELNFVFNPRLFSQLSRASFLIGAALISGWLWLLYSMIRRKRFQGNFLSEIFTDKL